MNKITLLIVSMSLLVGILHAKRLDDLEVFSNKKYLIQEIFAPENRLFVTPSTLPNPYKILLTQPLMTPTIEKHYGRISTIQTLAKHLDSNQHRYSRIIVMLLDANKERNQAKLARKKPHALIVELAFITINLKALPKNTISQILNTNIPFGKILIQHHIKTKTKNRQYFKIICKKELAVLTHCHLDDILYGRTNTMIRADTKQWLAHTIEILPIP